MATSSMNKRLDRIEKALLRNTMSLEEHMKRTALLEDEVKLLRKTDQKISFYKGLLDGGLKVVATIVALAVGLKSLNILKF